MKKYRRITALICAILMMTALCACESTNPDDYYIDGKSAGKDLGIISAADNLFTINCDKGYSFNPLVATNTNNQLVCNLVYENMVELDNSYNVKPNLITSWETADGITWTFHVDSERYFHDGSKMSAYDVAYSLLCAGSSARYKSRFYSLSSSYATDANTFVVTLSKSNMLFPMLLCIPVIKSGSISASYPQGTGPYTYSKNLDYLSAFKKYPGYENLPVDKIYLSEYEGGLETISAFEDSLVDVVMNDPTAPTNLGYGTANEVRGYNTTNMHYIGFNAYSRLFSNARMRLAMQYAFDREYLKAQMGGYAEATAIPVNPACAWYSKELNEEFSYNTAVCRNIFKGLGFEDCDDDGYMEMKDSADSYSEINIRLLVCSDSSAKVSTARKFAKDMDEMGVQVTLMEYAWSQYMDALNAGNFDMYYAETRINPDFDITPIAASDGMLNYGSWSSASVDSALRAYLKAGAEDRVKASEDMCRTLCNDGGIITLCFEKHQMITHRGVITGVKVNENNPLANVANWKISFADGIKDTGKKD